MSDTDVLDRPAGGDAGAGTGGAPEGGAPAAGAETTGASAAAPADTGADTGGGAGAPAESAAPAPTFIPKARLDQVLRQNREYKQRIEAMERGGAPADPNAEALGGAPAQPGAATQGALDPVFHETVTARAYLEGRPEADEDPDFQTNMATYLEELGARYRPDKVSVARQAYANYKRDWEGFKKQNAAAGAPRVGPAANPAETRVAKGAVQRLAGGTGGNPSAVTQSQLDTMGHEEYEQIREPLLRGEIKVVPG
jgi:hypothetical protein